MKKIYSLLVLALCLMAGLSANAQTVVFDFAANPWDLPLGSGSGETAAAGNITGPIVAASADAAYSVELTAGGSPTNPTRMWTGPQFRCYKGAELTLRPLDSSKAIVAVTFTASKFAITAAEGSFADKTWTGNQTEVTFAVTATNQITQIEVTLADVNDNTVTPGATVQTPVISPNGGTKTGSVTVTLSGDSTTMIYYTIDGNDPTPNSTLYTEPFTLTESATVKAIAYNAEGSHSAIASMTYTIEEAPVDTTSTDTTAAGDDVYYIFSPTNVIESGQQYLIVAPTASDTLYAAVTLTKNYGYLSGQQVFAYEQGPSVYTTNLNNAFVITQSEEATALTYTIQQADGRYLYQKGTYNSFNLDAAPTEGQYWTMALNNDGESWTITNTSVNKYIQYSVTHKSYGSYADEQGILPRLYVLSEVIGKPVDPDTTQTDTTTVDPNYETVTFPFSENPWQLETGSTTNSEGGAVTAPVEQDGAAFTATNGGGSTVVRMWDTNGKVTLRVYNGTAITFSVVDKTIVGVDFTTNGKVNLTALQGALDADNKTWTGNTPSITFVGNGTTQIQTVTLKLDDVNEATETPVLYIPAPVISPKGGEKNDSVVVSIKAADGAYIYYTVDGSEPTWDATLYTEPFKLTESATVKAIAYDDEGNGSAVTEAAYTIKITETPDTTATDTTDNGLVTKYIFTRTSTIESGKQYLIVANVDSKLLVAQAVTKNYGYLNVEEATATEDGNIELESLDNAFVITQSDGTDALSFTICQADQRYLYQKGTYNSFNLDATPTEGQYWSIEPVKEAYAWNIVNLSVNKTVQFDTSHNNFASYTEVTGALPELWVLTATKEEEVVKDTSSIFSDPATSSDNQFIVENTILPEQLTAIWKFDSKYGAVASGYDATNKQNLESESVMKTPAIEIPASSDDPEIKPVLSFEHAIGFVSSALAGGYMTVKARVTTSSAVAGTRGLKENVAEEEWKTLPLTFPDLKEGKNFSDYAEVEIDLSEFAGKTIEIGFFYKSDTEVAPTWEVRNIEVTCGKKSEDPTGVDALVIQPATMVNGAVYDLQGRRVTNPTHGIYIVGGRKVYIK